MLSSRSEDFDAGLVVALEEPEQLAGDDASEAAFGVAAGLALGGAAGHVGAGVGVGAQTMLLKLIGLHGLCTVARKRELL